MSQYPRIHGSLGWRLQGAECPEPSPRHSQVWRYVSLDTFSYLSVPSVPIFPKKVETMVTSMS